MKRYVSSLTFIVLSGITCAAPPVKDREAILNFAGSFKVVFSFEEVEAISEKYQLRETPYTATAVEIVKIVEDQPERIALQHLLVVKGKDDMPHVIKHWSQIWSWQDQAILDYCGEDDLHNWEKDQLTADVVKGSWSQLVTQIDDTPRYESFGRWEHQSDQSVWVSQLTRRPLPRREYSKRDDYDYILATNRHVITPNGWLHEQNNRKVVDRNGEDIHTLCVEKGLNSYTRTETEFTAVADEWWESREAFWNVVREFWRKEGERPGKLFSYHSAAEGKTLRKRLHEMSKEKLDSRNIIAALQPYLDVK